MFIYEKCCLIKQKLGKFKKSNNGAAEGNWTLECRFHKPMR